MTDKTSDSADKVFASNKQRRKIEEAVGEFGLACDRATCALREEAEALSRWGESRSDIADALCSGSVDALIILRHYADADALARAETARVEAVAATKRGHTAILAACLMLTIPE